MALGLDGASARRCYRRLLAAALLVPAFFLTSGGANALTVTTLKGQGLDSSFGEYAPGGDCTRQPHIMIDATGFTFAVGGKAIHPPRFEWAVSYGGQSYAGITTWFFPFMRTDDDLGPVLITLNEGEKRGRLTLENNDGKGLPAPYAALVQGSPYARCGKAVPTPAARPVLAAPAVPAGPAMPLEWAGLARASSSGEADLFGRGSVPAAITALLGQKVAVLQKNLSVSTMLTRAGNVYHRSGNADHRGGYDMAYVVIDPAQRAIEIGLWEGGKLTLYRTPGKRVALPAEIASFRSEQPPEEAEAAPGPAWELRPLAGQTPLALGQPAASTHISTLSLYCEKGQPVLGMLLYRSPGLSAIKLDFVFTGGLVPVQVNPVNGARTLWLAYVGRSQVVKMLMTQKDRAYLRINDAMEGEVNLAGAPQAVRTALRSCMRF